MEGMENILVVDDEESIAIVVKAYLEKEGYGVYTAYSGREALEVFNRNSIDFIILDLMLPDLMGEEVCRKIRKHSSVPILMLSAKVEESDKITGLDLGADDYLTKPFSPKELMARVRAILRRSNSKETDGTIVIGKGELTINLNNMEVKKGNQLVELTATEFKIINLLTQNIGRVFTREELIRKILGYDYEGFDRTIDTHIKNIRHKIEDDSHRYITTVYGVGYKFTED